MMMCERSRLGGKWRYRIAAAAMSVFLLLQARPAQAQLCEPFFVTIAAQEILVAAQDYLIDTMFMPPGEIYTLPGLMLETTNWAMYLVGGSESASIQIPGLQSAIDTLNGLVITRPVATILEDVLSGPYGSIVPGIATGGTEFHVGGLGYMDIAMRARLDEFWLDIFNAMRAMTAQLQASDLNTARMLASIFDSADLAASARDLQTEEIQDKTDISISDSACRFDTFAPSRASAQAVSKAITNTYTKSIGDIALNKAGTVGANGSVSFTAARWKSYMNKFCDSTSNHNKTPCQENLPLANATVQPGKTLFGKHTIDLSDPDMREAVQILTENIIAFHPPVPLPAKALQSPAGREQRIRNREYAAQMDAVSALVTSIIGERAPATPSPEVTGMRAPAPSHDGIISTAYAQPADAEPTGEDVQETRLAAGATDASPTPSMREIRQAEIEDLQRLDYYADLNDGGGTAAQKELYLRALNAMLIYQMLEKQEKISTAFAIETANMLKKHTTVRGLHRGGQPW